MVSDSVNRLFAAPSLRPRGNRGLTLMECALALLIVGLSLVVTMEMNFRTISTSRRARNNLQAALLANEIMSTESMGDFPQSPEEPVLKGMQELLPDDRWVDEETGYFPYRGYYYEVEKEIEEISGDTDLSMTAEEREAEELQGAVEEGDPPKTLEVVRVRVTIRYPLVADPDRRGATAEFPGGDYKELVIETYVIDPIRRKSLAGQGAANEGDTGGGN